MSQTISGLSALAGRYDAILSDVWGVIHNGMRAYREAYQALEAFRRTGRPVVLISNAPRQSPVVVGQLDRLGVPRSAYDAIVTSGDVTRAYMRERPGAKVHHLGPPRDHVVFDGMDAPRVGVEAADYVVCTGLVDDRRETPDDYAERLAAIRARGLFFVCGNPDKVVEVGKDLIYCAGALGDRYAELGGEVLYAGKPYAPAYDGAIAAAEAILGRKLDRSRILAIGDALRTDVKGAVAMGLDSLFLAEGIHAHEVLKDGAIDEAAYAALIAAAGVAPTYRATRLLG